MGGPLRAYGSKTGCYQHWTLMQEACAAKFPRHAEARTALLGTGTRPLVHRVRRHSRTIAGVAMAQIWVTLRDRLQPGDSHVTVSEP